MGMTWENLTLEQLCDLMCGGPEPEPEDFERKEVTDEDGQEPTEINV